MSQKKKNDVVKEKKKPQARHLDHQLKVSKSVKVMATMAARRGYNFKEMIRLLGEAEDVSKKNGRLVLKGA